MSKYIVFNTMFRRVTAGCRFKRNRRLQKKQNPIRFRTGFCFWSYWPDLNRRPADYESAALPTEPQ